MVWSNLDRLEGEVTYFCFIESSILSVPHMEPLAAEDPGTAAAEAEMLLAGHASGYAAQIFADGQKIVTVRRERDARAFDAGRTDPV
jgi:hypothetical protein